MFQHEYFRATESNEPMVQVMTDMQIKGYLLSIACNPLLIKDHCLLGLAERVGLIVRYGKF